MRILEGDVLAVLPTLEASGFDACLCDPPYGLGFMGKDWDHGIPGPSVWAKVFRVLKPGAFLLAFGGTRTHHRLMCAIEDAGFEIRDCMMWLYGQGFPKSLDIGKAIDKAAGFTRDVVGINETFLAKKQKGSNSVAQGWSRPWMDDPAAVRAKCEITAPASDAAKLWDGYGTALKPAYEPIIVAMKPCEGTFAENALKHGVAGINIEAGRIGTEQRTYKGSGPYQTKIANHGKGDTGFGLMDGRGKDLQFEATGRWPSNVILDEEAGAMLDEQSGDLGKSSGGGMKDLKRGSLFQGATNPNVTKHCGLGDSGGASRFFYCAKASKSERGEGNNHPTVKPLKLIEYLARLILPPQGGKLLVPFSGSGSEMLGARNAGWKDVTGIEQSHEYAAIARRRLGTAQRAA